MSCLKPATTPASCLNVNIEARSAWSKWCVCNGSCSLVWRDGKKSDQIKHTHTHTHTHNTDRQESTCFDCCDVSATDGFLQVKVKKFIFTFHTTDSVGYAHAQDLFIYLSKS